jgi:poly-gamma-glutamate synthesis protein (capsule biosynthesis protein)
MDAPDRTLLGFVGDLLVDRDDPESVFDAVAEALATPDILFGNCEVPYTADPHLAPSSPDPLFAHPDNTRALHHFDVLSLANNHVVDAGHDAMLETAEHLRRVGAVPVGIGRDIDEARRPAVVERNGLRVAYLAYASVFPHGYEARAGWPGLAPVRSLNHHVERLPNYWGPGIPGRVVSLPHEEDLAALRDDLASAKAQFDLVVASFHWGDFERPFALTDHERRTARFAVDHGADVVVGHHHHIPRGMEWYAGRPIFYGLGHFVFDVRDPNLPDWYAPETEPTGEADSYAFYPRPGWPLLPMHPDARMTMLAWTDVDRGGVRAAGLLPCTLAPDGRVHPHDARSDAGRSVLAYLQRACDAQDLGVTLTESERVRIGGLTTAEFEAAR